MGAVERFCDRAMLIERGKVLGIDKPQDDRARLQRAQLRPARAREPGEGPLRRPAGVRDRRAWFEMDGQRVTELPHGYPLDVVYTLRFHEAIEDPVFAISIRNDAGHTVFVSSTQLQNRPTGAFAPGETVTVRFSLTAWFTLGRYLVTPSVARAGSGSDAIDLREDMNSVIIHGLRPHRGDRRLPAHHRRHATPDDRRRTPPREPHLDARPDRVEAALLRIGARLRVDARAPVRVLRRRSSSCSPRSPTSAARCPEYGVVHPLRARPVHVLRRDHVGVPGLARAAREPAAQDALPAPRDPAVGRRHRVAEFAG